MRCHSISAIDHALIDGAVIIITIIIIINPYHQYIVLTAILSLLVAVHFAKPLLNQSNFWNLLY